MICEACGSTIPDDAAVCPECGVSTSLFLEKPPLQTVTQTVPGFVKKSGSDSDIKSESDPGKTEDLQTVKQAQPDNRSEVSNYQRANNYSSAKSGSDKNTFASIGLFLSTFTLLIGGTIALLWIFLNIWLDIFSLYSYFMFILPIAFVFSIIGVLVSIKRTESSLKAVVGLILCLLAVALFLYIYKYCLSPNILKSVSEFLPSGIPKGF